MIRKISKFLKIDISYDEVEKLKQHLNFETIKNIELDNFNQIFGSNKISNNPFSEDFITAFLNHQEESMIPEMYSEFDKWVKENRPRLSLQSNKIKKPRVL